MLVLNAVLPMVLLAIGAWLASLLKNDVSIADSLWPLFILLAAATYFVAAPQMGPRSVVVASLIAVWALRLAAHITWRSWGEPEDRRYKAMRARNEQHYRCKSLVLVWWGIYLIAPSTPAWWAIASPLMMTVRLLKGFGVALLEQDMTERRPGYREYFARTNAFFPERARQTQHGRLRRGLPLKGAPHPDLCCAA